MSGGPKGAKQPLERPLDGGVSRLIAYSLTGPHFNSGLGIGLHFSNASALVAPFVVRKGAKHSMLSRYKLSQVSQSVESVTPWAGRFAVAGWDAEVDG